MHASIVYLLVLLGVGLGIALGGLMGGLVGGVGFFLLHRVYALSKRLSDIDEHLRSLDAMLPFDEQKPSPPSVVATSVESVAVPVVVPDAPLAEPRSSVPVPPDTEAIAALNTTLQALLPVLNALKAPEATPSHEVKPEPPSEPALPQTVQATNASDTQNEPCGNIEKPEVSECASIATAIELILLDALRNSTLGSLPQSAERQAPAPAAQQVIAAPIIPTAAQDTLSKSAEPTHYQPVANDLGRLKDELSTLMNDISAEHARQSQTGQSQAVSTPHTEGTTVDSRSLQELLIELRKLTAKMPPPQD